MLSTPAAPAQPSTRVRFTSLRCPHLNRLTLIPECSEIDVFPNASISEYGTVHGEDNMMAEIYARGPIACGINAEPVLNYTGGIFEDDLKKV